MQKTKVKKESPNKNPTNPQTLEVESQLTLDERLRVIQWLVELKTSRQIVGLIDMEFGKTLNHTSIWRYAHCKKWKPLIARLRQEFERNLVKIPIANKADRLRYYQKIVDEALTWRLKGRTPFGDSIFEIKLGAAVKAIEGAKEEVSPSKGTDQSERHLHFSKITINLDGISKKDLIDLILGRNNGADLRKDTSVRV